MNAQLDCLPCLGRNAVDFACKTTKDENKRHAIVSKSMHLLADCDMSMPPPFYITKIIDITTRENGGVMGDPFLPEKVKSTELANKLVNELHRIPAFNPNDFESRLRLSIAGNILDFGIYSNLDIEQALNSMQSAFTKKLDRNDVLKLKERMDSAKNIMFILDNCGEAVFDRIFMEPYRDKITLAVRGKPTLNDVTRGDLEASGLIGFTKAIVDNGSDLPGSVLSCASKEFVDAFNDADLIVGKGQGNFETLCDTPDKPLALIFLTKCPVVCRLLGAPQNSLQLFLKNF